jgi:hypothetical protein
MRVIPSKYLIPYEMVCWNGVLMNDDVVRSTLLIQTSREIAEGEEITISCKSCRLAYLDTISSK